MNFMELVRRLGEDIGAEGGVTPDADGVVHLACGELIVSLMSRGDRLLMLGPVCELPQEGGDRLATALLRGNFPLGPKDGGILSLSEGKTVFLHRSVPLETVEADEILGELDDFIIELVTWRENVKDMIKDGVPEPKAGDAGTPDLGDGFVRA